MTSPLSNINKVRRKCADMYSRSCKEITENATPPHRNADDLSAAFLAQTSKQIDSVVETHISQHAA